MRAEIVKLHKQLDTTMIYVTHDQVEAMTMANRIVVMKDGVILQNDTPLNVYNHPVNLFVAGFIGSPSINQFSGKIVMDGNEMYFEEGSFRVKVLSDKMQLLSAYAGRNVIMGLRPEDIYDAQYATMAEFPQNISALVDLVEPMGNEFIVFFTTPNSKITARFDPKKLPQVNTNMPVTFDMSKAHFFDAETEACIF
jgi:multiple sugar transport system ATP-binding protein